MATKSSGTGQYRAGMGTGPSEAARITAAQNTKSDDGPSFGEELVKRRHPDWIEHQIEWRRKMDCHEGGSRARNATYGLDRRGLPDRMLMRHDGEYPDAQMNPQVFEMYAGYSTSFAMGDMAGGIGPLPGMLGADAYATAHDDDYELRRARTPFPPFVREACEIHIGKVYDQEVERDGPDELIEWWKDVDGSGTTIDDYMQETIAPLLLVLGIIDVCFDHPRVPEGVDINNQADVLANGLDKCVASYILPENMVWWRADLAGRFAECLVREYVEASDRNDLNENGDPIDPEAANDISEKWRREFVRWRHWTSTESTLYNYDGKEVVEPAIPHGFGRPPIRRLVHQKKHRTRNIGNGQYDATCEYAREYYNRDSELILNDVLQAHPHLSGPEDFCKAENAVLTGPGNILPKKQVLSEHGHQYEGWEYVSPPKDPAESLRKNMQVLLDHKDRINGLTKPAGVQGTTGGTVGQSGISKSLDAVAGNKILGKIAKSLARAERFMAEYAYMVLNDAVPPPDIQEKIKVGYPTKFELDAADEIGNNAVLFQTILTGAGQAPNAERELLEAMLRRMLVGLDDEAYKLLDEELLAVMTKKATIAEKQQEMSTNAMSDDEALEGDGSEEQAAGQDNTGQSAATMMGNTMVTVQ